ncbi:MAG: hypothetical protein V3T33_00430, partial [Myxococcota bacterium]
MDMKGGRTWLASLLPWTISSAALVYVFGYAIDWKAIPGASSNANLPLFIAITVADKCLFFAFWGIVQTALLRRFVGPITLRGVIAVKGGSELLRAVNNPVADAAFLLGVAEIARGNRRVAVAVASIPFGLHFLVLLLQATLSLSLLVGGAAGNLDVVALILAGWGGVAVIALAVRLGWWHRLLEILGVARQLGQLRARQLLPFVGWFILFAAFDVLIQGSATRAFGVPIGWSELIARLPILYVVMSLPSLGNFGTREIAWAQCFSEFGSTEALTAFALWTNVIFLCMHVLIGVFF